MWQPLVEVIKTRKVGKNGYANMIRRYIFTVNHKNQNNELSFSCNCNIYVCFSLGKCLIKQLLNEKRLLEYGPGIFIKILSHISA